MEPLIKKAFVSATLDKIYYARIFDDYEECSCPGFLHRQDCRHLKELRQKLEERNNLI